MGAEMTYAEFLEQTALEVWWQWNTGEVRWRGSIPQEPKAYDYGVSTWSFGRDVWDLVEAKYGAYGYRPYVGSSALRQPSYGDVLR